ncbi:hypothetical protein H0H87_008963 [Tephrocybe sp. NHM501043]|nr:hypothetical protein H0H87_008963 [Tephrocybe sp. NHM501043]
MAQSKPAGFPFDLPEADLILRSSDRPIPTDFRVFKLLLSIASPFFASAFTLPQPPVNGSGDIPVMEMQEDEHTLTMILGFCVPISVHLPPSLDSLKDIQGVLQAAVKFEMKGIEGYIRKVLFDRFIESKPLQVFAIAHNRGWKKLAALAARFYLTVPAKTVTSDELELISAAAYHRLMVYRQKCGEAAKQEILRRLAANPSSSRPWAVQADRRRTCSMNERCGGPRAWWLCWMEHTVTEDVLAVPLPNRSDIRHTLAVGKPKIVLCNKCSKSIAAEFLEYVPSIVNNIQKIVLQVDYMQTAVKKHAHVFWQVPVNLYLPELSEKMV